ncbi:hypothetical protein [Geodermatophilus sp. URMC 64]
MLGVHVQPLIRYRIPDSFVVQPQVPGRPAHLRAVVRGRSDDVLRFGDRAVHPWSSGRLAVALADAGLRGADVSVEGVPVLARDERTGKLRRFVPLG